MGFYVRKSVKAGPFRFNLSKSGIGVSAGVPGFRVGTGPRGNYVHLGRGGVYYRTSLSGPGSSAPRPETAPSFSHTSSVVMEDVTGATALEMAPTGGGDVVEQLNAAARHFRLGWWTAAAVLVLGAAAMPWGLLIWALGVPLCVWLFFRDASKTKVVLFYDVNDAAAAWFDSLVGGWSLLTDTKKLWRTISSGQVSTLHQHKTNAGASNLVQRVDATASLAGPRHLATNVAVPSIAVGKASVHFLPDRVLVREGKTYSDVSYRHLNARGYQARFIESVGRTPRDAIQVDQTWQYVNKKGGPDRRYANNPVLPIMMYGHLELTSPNGLQWKVQSSRADAAPTIAETLQHVPSNEVAG